LVIVYKNSEKLVKSVKAVKASANASSIEVSGRECNHDFDITDVQIKEGR